MRPLAGALAALVALASASPAPAQTPHPSPTPAALAVRGQFLSLGKGYLIFTTGDALAVDPALRPPPGLRIGMEVRAALDPSSHRVASLERADGSEPGDVDIEKLSREYVVADPRSARATASPAAAASSAPSAEATITIYVRVPGSTPAGDDVYVSTDRSNFTPSEIRMVRLDASRWSAQLRLPAGSRLRYDFSRGSFGNLERTRTGGIVTPRTIVATNGEKTDDTVESWADSN